MQLRAVHFMVLAVFTCSVRASSDDWNYSSEERRHSTPITVSPQSALKAVTGSTCAAS